jgi:hypothetical protein
VFDFIAALFDFMGADNAIEVIGGAKVGGDVGAELDANAAFGGRASEVGLRVGPEHFAHESLIGRLLEPINFTEFF